MTPEQHAFLYGYARRRLNLRHHDAQDLVQDVALKELQNVFRHDMPDDERRAWLITVLRNLQFSRWRQQRFQRRVCHFTRTDQHIDSSAESAVMLEELISKPSLYGMTRDQMSTAVRIATGATYDDVATEDQVAVGTVKSRSGRARAALASV